MSDGPLRQQIAEALLQAHRDFESVPQVQRETLGTTDREALTAHQADAVVALLGLTEEHGSQHYGWPHAVRFVTPWRLPTEDPNAGN